MIFEGFFWRTVGWRFCWMWHVFLSKVYDPQGNVSFSSHHRYSLNFWNAVHGLNYHLFLCLGWSKTKIVRQMLMMMTRQEFYCSIFSALCVSICFRYDRPFYVLEERQSCQKKGRWMCVRVRCSCFEQTSEDGCVNRQKKQQLANRFYFLHFFRCRKLSFVKSCWRKIRTL